MNDIKPIGKLLILLVGSTNLFAEPAEIVGKISQGTESVKPEVVLPELEESDIQSETVVWSGGRRVRYIELTSGALVKMNLVSGGRDVPPKSPSLRPQPEARFAFSVLVKQFPNQISFVQWWDGTQKHSAWSNIDFKLLEGISQISKERKDYTFQLFVQRAPLSEFKQLVSEDGESLPAPDLTREIPGFQSLSPSEEQAEAFMLGLHEVYSHRERDLKQAAASRKQALINRKQERLLNSGPEDLEIRFRAGKPSPSEVAE